MLPCARRYRAPYSNPAEIVQQRATHKATRDMPTPQRQRITQRSVLEAFEGSDSHLTRSVTATLRRRGPAGELASWLFTVQKASMRAKMYGQTKWRGKAYDRKEWAIKSLCLHLVQHPDLVERWGWGRDAAPGKPPLVLYVDLPTGQVSFHCHTRHAGPDYPGQWDGILKASAGRILTYCEEVLVS